MSIEAVRKLVVDVVSAADIPLQDKIQQLKTIEQTKYKPLIRELAYKKTLFELQDLVKVLEDLAYLSANLGELSDHLQHYTDAAVFYQNALTTINEKINPDKSNTAYISKIDQIYKALDVLSNKLIAISAASSTTIFSNTYAESDQHKKILYEMREEIADKVSAIEEYPRQSSIAEDIEIRATYQELYVNSTRKLFEEITERMQGFLAKLYHDAESEIGQPPCKYAVIGLGSMALKQITPYSDLEFAILTENDNYKYSDWPTIREYFKNLSYLVNFKMINLGETIIPTSRYGLDMSYLVHRAINFDLGGKTPLGRIEHDKPYDLVQTVEKMLSYVYNAEDKASHIDKNLPFILEKICYVYGEEALVREYQGQVTTFLHSKVVKTSKLEDLAEDSVVQEELFNYQERALKRLKEGVVEIDYAKYKEVEAKGYLGQFKPLTDAEEGAFDVKEEIYRLPDRLLYSLGLYYGICGDSSWDIVDQLYEGSIINQEAALHLKNTVTFVNALRLKTYLHNKGQIEDMSVFADESRAEQAKSFHLSAESLGVHGGLFEYFYIALPLHSELDKFCSQSDSLTVLQKKIFFQNHKFYDDTIVSKGLIHYRLYQEKEAQSYLEDALRDAEQTDILQIRKILGNIYINFGEADKAIEQRLYCLELELRNKGRVHPDIAKCLNAIGHAYRVKGYYDEAINYLTQGLEMRHAIYQEVPDSDIAYSDISHSYNHLGLAHGEKGNYSDAMQCFIKSLEIWPQLQQ